jgi:hypothetical protein
MAKNSLAPGFGKLFYSRTGLLKPHVMTFGLNPHDTPTPGFDPDLDKSGGGTIPFSDAIDAIIVLLKAITSHNMTFTHCEFWSQPTKDDDPLFIFDHSIGVAGTDSGAHVVAEQLVITYRTNAGGLYRFYQMEGTAAVDIVAFPPFSTLYANWSNYLLGADDVIYGRDNGYPSSVISLKTKTNDALRRQLITG